MPPRLRFHFVTTRARIRALTNQELTDFLRWVSNVVDRYRNLFRARQPFAHLPRPEETNRTMRANLNFYEQLHRWAHGEFSRRLLLQIFANLPHLGRPTPNGSEREDLGNMVNDYLWWEE